MSNEDRDRRREILDAALDCFLDAGFDFTTIQDIRARSGASIGSIYHAFSGGKDAIATELLLDTVGEWQESLLAALDGATGAEGLVRAAVTHYVEWVVRAPARARFLLASPRFRLEAASRERVQARNRELLRELKRRIQPHLASGQVRSLPMDLLIPVVIGPAMEWARQWLAGLGRSSPNEAKRHLADAAWAAIRRA